MRIQVICEGPSDRDILHELMLRINSDKIDFLEESKSQMTHRGKHALLSNYRIFAKFCIMRIITLRI